MTAFKDPDEVYHAVRAAMINSGQACVAPTRLLISSAAVEQVCRLAAETVSTMKVGHPDSGADLGPVVNASQWLSIQDMIQSGLDEGAALVAGGPGRPDGLGCGYYVRPTVFLAENAQAKIVREEIFGPVLVIPDKDGWHAFEAAGGPNHRRIRRLDVWFEQDELVVNEWFQDSAALPNEALPALSSAWHRRHGRCARLAGCSI